MLELYKVNDHPIFRSSI